MPELRAALAGAGVPSTSSRSTPATWATWRWPGTSPRSTTRPRRARRWSTTSSPPRRRSTRTAIPTTTCSRRSPPTRAGRPSRSTDDMLRGWDTYYGSLRCFDWLSLSAVDLAAVRAAGPAMADLAGRLRAGLAADPAKYGGAVRERRSRTSLSAWDSWQLDLGMFAGRLVDGHELDDDPGLRRRRGGRARRRERVDGPRRHQRVLRALVPGAHRLDRDRRRVDRVPPRVHGRSRCSAPASATGGVDWYRLLRDYNDERPGRSGDAGARLAAGHLRAHRRVLRRRPPRLGDRLRQRQERERRAAHGERRPSVEDGAAVGRRRLLGERADADPGGSLWVAGSEGWDGALIARSADKGATWSVRLGADARVPARHRGGDGEAAATPPGRAERCCAPRRRRDVEEGRHRSGGRPPRHALRERHRGLGARERRRRRRRDGAAHRRRRRDVDGADQRAGHAAVRRRQRRAGRLGGRRRSFGRPGPRRRARQRRRRAAAQRRRRRDVGDAVGRRSRGPASERRRHAGRAGRAGRSATAAPPRERSSCTPPTAATRGRRRTPATSPSTSPPCTRSTRRPRGPSATASRSWRRPTAARPGPSTPRRRGRPGHAREAGRRRGAAPGRRCATSSRDDGSSRVRVTIHISDGRGHLLKTRPLGWQRTGAAPTASRFRCDLPRGTYFVKALADRPAGNAQSRRIGRQADRALTAAGRAPRRLTPPPPRL